MAERRQVRFVLLGDLSPISRRLGGEAAVRPVAEWVRAHGAPVDPSLWRSAARGAGGSSRRGLGAAMELYDLRPQAGLVRAGG
jgi:hypothetical protein